jgi:dihydroorotase
VPDEDPRTLFIRGGDVVDRDGRRRADVLLSGDRIVAVGPDIDPPADARVVDAGGCIVAPALVDLHAHLREPGREEAETIETGTRAAALGGYGHVVAMPNTDPAIDSVEVAGWIRERARRSGVVEVTPAAAITVARAGEQLAPMGELAADPDSQVTIFTDDGAGVQDDLLMRRAMEYSVGVSARVGRPIVLAQHCEIDRLAAGGCMHEGEWSAKLGVPGIPAEAEELMVARDLALGRLTGARLHFQHLSTAGSVDLVRTAKAAGMAVTAEATTHHFTLTHAELVDYDPVFKVNPPLRTDEDVAAIRAGLADGTIDAIATDHAPHTQDAKERPLDQAPPGMLGLETALALALTELDLPVERVLALMSWQPAEIAGLAADAGGRIEADRYGMKLCVFDPDVTWTVDRDQLASLSRNTPYAGRTLRGRVRHTIIGSEIVVLDGEAQR